MFDQLNAVAVCSVLRNPLLASGVTAKVALPGQTLRDLAPPDNPIPPICRLNGEWILRRDWDYVVQPGDNVQFCVIPQGGGGKGGSNPLQFVVMIVLIIASQGTLAPALAELIGAQAANAVILAGASALANVIVPTEKPEAQTGTSASPVYNVSLSGNQARLEQPIPAIFGRHKIYPDFAAEPYHEWIDNEQFYHALYCIGQGNYDFEARLLDDTHLENFSDVQVVVLPPGALPTLVASNVTNAPEVTGQDLRAGIYVGGYCACSPRLQASHIGVDVTWPRGLANFDNDDNLPEPYTVSWRVEVREVNEFGTALENWTILASETATEAEARPLTKSHKYALPRIMRPQVRLVRISPFNESNRVSNELTWSALRAFIAGDPAPFTVDITDQGNELSSSWTYSAAYVEPFNTSAVIQSNVRGNPAPSYAAVRDEGGGAAYAYRDFSIEGATEALVTLDFLFNNAGVNNDWFPRKEMQFGVQTTAAGAGLRVSVIDYDGQRGDPNAAFLSIINAPNWRETGTVLGQVQLSTKLSLLVPYSLQVDLTVNGNVSTVTATVRQGTTQLGVLSLDAVFPRGRYCGFTNIHGPDAAASVDGLPQGWVTYYDNIHVVASGMSSFSTAPLCPTATHVELRVKASEQLTGFNQRKVAFIVQRLLRTWHPTTGWSAEVPTRSIAWALAEKWTNSVYGDGLSDSRCDLQALYDLEQIWAARQDRFDFTFDQRMDSDAADQLIAAAGRARVFRRNGVRTLTRDQHQDLPAAAFPARSIQPGSVSIKYMLANEETADGVVVEYFDNRSWDWMDITCPAPGVTTPTKPARVRYRGITGAKHAEREGLYQAAQNMYRRKYPSWKTEMEGMLPALGTLVAFAPALPGWGQSGDVVEAAGTRITVSEPLVWTPGALHYFSFIQSNGKPTTPVLVTPGPTDDSLLLPAVPTIAVVAHDAASERTKYVFGAANEQYTGVRVLGIQPELSDDGVRLFNMTGVNEDPRVHTADTHLLPANGEIQDPVDPGEAVGNVGPGGGGGVVVYLLNHSIASMSGPGSDVNARVTLSIGNDGVVQAQGVNLRLPPISFRDEFDSEWILTRPIEPTVAGLYEVLFTFVSHGFTSSAPEDSSFVVQDAGGAAQAAVSGVFGTWQNLADTRSITVTHPTWTQFTPEVVTFTVQIREIVTGVIHVSRTMQLALFPYTSPG